MNYIEDYYERDLNNANSYVWIILSLFVPFVLYYVMYKIAKSVDDHVRHKKAIYFTASREEIPSDLRKALDNFPADTMMYYWFFLFSGLFEFAMGIIFPIDLKTFYVPMPLIFAFLVNFFFLVILVDAISKRFYVHQMLEDDVNINLINDPVSVKTFKKRSGLTFLLLSIVTIEIYVYVYIFLITKEYTNHVMKDYENMRRIQP